MRLVELAKVLRLTYRGSSDFDVIGLCTVDHPREGHLSFARSPNYLRRLFDADFPMAVLTKPDWIEQLNARDHWQQAEQAYLFSASPYDSFIDAMAVFFPPTARQAGISTEARIGAHPIFGKNVSVADGVVIGDGVELADDVSLAPGCVLGDGVYIGAHTQVDANVSIFRHCRIGAHCRLLTGCVIGSEGFGFLPDDQGGWRRVPHHGTVTVGDRVRVGANTTIDRAVLDATVIESGVKLDNLIQIGHNVFIGENTAIAAGTLIAGHAHIGRRCQLAGGVNIAAVRLADDTTVLGQTGVSHDIKQSGTVVSGYMGFMSAPQWRRWVASLRRMSKKS